jgi:hypothetical protein
MVRTIWFESPCDFAEDFGMKEKSNGNKEEGKEGQGR